MKYSVFCKKWERLVITSHIMIFLGAELLRSHLSQLYLFF